MLWTLPFFYWQNGRYWNVYSIKTLLKRANSCNIFKLSASIITYSSIIKQTIMRKFSLVLVAAALFISGNLFANDSNNTDPQRSLKTQIQELLKVNKLVVEDYEELTAKVLFTVNSEEEIVVISVETDDSDLESFIKSKLNYKKVELSEFVEGRMYRMPLRVKA